MRSNDSKLIKKDYLKKINLINKYNKAYYKNSMPIVADFEYDHLKLEILDLEKDWKQYPALEALKRFKYDGNHGIYLKTSSGSATFLPVVARDNMDWSIQEYMEQLSFKATRNKDTWKNPNSIIKIYQSRSFIFDPRLNKIMVKL